jgi:Domain of unknown function (DUF4365)
MPRRPESHVIGSRARTAVSSAFEEAGWTAEIVKEDYGEDLLVRIFRGGVASPLTFWVQVKGMGRVRRPGSQPRILTLRVDNDHGRSWSRMHQPVMLAVWDGASEEVYWQFWHDAVRRQLPTKVAVTIPIEQSLNREGVVRIEERVSAYYQRIESLRIVLEDLAKELREYVPILDVERGVMVLRRPDGALSVKLFGPNLDPLVRAVADRSVRSFEEADSVVKEALENHFGEVMQISDKQVRSLRKASAELKTTDASRQ